MFMSSSDPWSFSDYTETLMVIFLCYKDLSMCCVCTHFKQLFFMSFGVIKGHTQTSTLQLLKDFKIKM